MESIQNIESKWQKYWSDNHTFEAKIDKNKEKYYYLVEFPYPSGSGLHVGHVRSYTALDALARKKRLMGYNVGELRKPLSEMSEENLEKLKSVLSKHDLI